MQPERVAAVYRWATMGGVERVLINRALAFRRADYPVSTDVCFLEDGGGIRAFSEAIKESRLEPYLKLQSRIDPAHYDRIFVIDTPEFLHSHPRDLSRMFVECHSGYPEGRAYLRQLPSSVRGVIAPSQHFAQLIASEASLALDRVHVLRNFVPTSEVIPTPPLPWPRGFILYVGRVDRHKNVAELVRGLKAIVSLGHPGVPLVVFGHEVERHYLESIVTRSNLAHLVAVFPPIPFQRVGALLTAASAAGGIFASASIAESFSLAAAEAICAGMPAVLSDNPAHRSFVEAGGVELFSLGDPGSFVDAWLKTKNGPDVSKRPRFCDEQISEAAFLEDWSALDLPAS